MSDWLPLIMPRPEIFRSNDAPPDLIEIDEPLLVEVRLEKGALSITHLACLDRPDMDRSIEVSSVLWDVRLETAAEDLACHRVSGLLKSILPFIDNHLFDQGCAIPDSRTPSYRGSTLAQFEADYVFYFTRSFITFTRTSIDGRPFYNSKHCTWINPAASLDFSAWPDGCPFQVLVPYDRSHLSRHEQIKLSALLDQEIQWLGHKLGWGSAAPAVTIDMQALLASA
jgi:hypothetical protein